MTALLYLENAYLKEMEATITEVAKEADGQQRWQLVLDKTIFYPRGGDQAIEGNVEKLATPLDFRYFFSLGRLALLTMKPELLAMLFAIFY